MMIKFLISFLIVSFLASIGLFRKLKVSYNVVTTIGVSLVLFINIAFPIRIFMNLANLQEYYPILLAFYSILYVTVITLFKGKDLPTVGALLLTFTWGLTVATAIYLCKPYLYEFMISFIEFAVVFFVSDVLFLTDSNISIMKIPELLNPAPENSTGTTQSGSRDRGVGSTNNSGNSQTQNNIPSNSTTEVPSLDVSSFHNFGLSLSAKAQYLSQYKPLNGNGEKSLSLAEFGIRKNTREYEMLCEVFPIDPSSNQCFANTLHSSNYRRGILWSTREHFVSPGNSFIENFSRH